MQSRRGVDRSGVAGTSGLRGRFGLRLDEHAPGSGQRAAARQACIDGANKIPDATARNDVLKQCERIGHAGANQKQTGARKACVDGADQIPVANAREAVLKQCNKLPE